MTSQVQQQGSRHDTVVILRKIAGNTCASGPSSVAQALAVASWPSEIKVVMTSVTGNSRGKAGKCMSRDTAGPASCLCLSMSDTLSCKSCSLTPSPPSAGHSSVPQSYADADRDGWKSYRQPNLGSWQALCTKPVQLQRGLPICDESMTRPLAISNFRKISVPHKARLPGMASGVQMTSYKLTLCLDCQSKASCNFDGKPGVVAIQAGVKQSRGCCLNLWCSNVGLQTQWRRQGLKQEVAEGCFCACHWHMGRPPGITPGRQRFLLALPLCSDKSIHALCRSSWEYT